MSRRDWIALVMDSVRDGSAKLDILRRRPLVGVELTLDLGPELGAAPAPRSLIEWLAFDASWLSRRTLRWPMLASGRLQTHVHGAVPDARVLWLSNDHTVALVVGIGDEPPVVSVKPLTHDGDVVGPEVATLIAASFGTWLAGQAGIIRRQDVLVADPEALDALRGVPALAALTRYLPKTLRAVELPRLEPRPKSVPLEPDAPLASDKARKAWLEEVVLCDDAPNVRPALAQIKRGARFESLVDDVLQTALVEGCTEAAREIIRAVPEVASVAHARTAGAFGRIDVLRLLLDGGIDANATSEDDDEPIVMVAACNGELACVELLVARGANPNDALLGACSAYEGRGAAVGAWLLDHGADANATRDGHSALHGAATRGDLALVETLLAHGADRHALTDRGESVIDYANPHLPHGVEPKWFKKLRVLVGDS